MPKLAHETALIDFGRTVKSHYILITKKPLIWAVCTFQADISDTVEGAVKVGLDATQEAARIGINAVSVAPQILNQKFELVQGIGKTVSDTSGLVQKV